MMQCDSKLSGMETKPSVVQIPEVEGWGMVPKHGIWHIWLNPIKVKVEGVSSWSNPTKTQYLLVM